MQFHQFVFGAHLFQNGLICLAGLIVAANSLVLCVSFHHARINSSEKHFVEQYLFPAASLLFFLLFVVGLRMAILGGL